MNLVFGETEIANAIANFADRLGYDVDWKSTVRLQVDSDNNWTATITIKDKNK